MGSSIGHIKLEFDQPVVYKSRAQTGPSLHWDVISCYWPKTKQLAIRKGHIHKVLAQSIGDIKLDFDQLFQQSRAQARSLFLLGCYILLLAKNKTTHSKKRSHTHSFSYESLGFSISDTILDFDQLFQQYRTQDGLCLHWDVISGNWPKMVII